ALIADAGHNLGDVLGLVCAWTAIRLSRRLPGGRFTYGLGRSSVLAALANAVLLLLACGAIAWEAIGRLASPPNVAGATVMGVAVILVSTWSLLRDSVHLSLDGVPAGVNSNAVMSFLAGQRGVTDVHDLHI